MKKGDIFEVKIEKVIFTGLGLAFHDGWTVIVETGRNKIPVEGETWKVQATRVKLKNKNKGVQVMEGKIKGKIEAFPVEIVEVAKYKIPAKCDIFGLCGGCLHQDIPYDKQLEWKQNQVEESFGKLYRSLDIDMPQGLILPIKASPDILRYRNKMEYSFSDVQYVEDFDKSQDVEKGIFIGFKPRGLYTKVVSPSDCFLQDDRANVIRNIVTEFAKDTGLPAYNYLTNEGCFKFLILRFGINTSEVLINLVISESYKDQNIDFIQMVDSINKVVKDLKVSIVVSYTRERSSSSFTDDIHVFQGDAFVNENILGMNFKIEPFAFFQTNTKGAEVLYLEVLDCLKTGSSDNLLFDLYAGTGSIGQIIASKSDYKKVIAIEEHPGAVRSANLNAQVNNLSGRWEIIEGQVENILPKISMDYKGEIDCVIDPPRNGMHPTALETVIKIAPKNICYVSCNISTLVRDLETLGKYYHIKSVVPVDMFPHTPHIEIVCGLKKKD